MKTSQEMIEEHLNRGFTHPTEDMLFTKIECRDLMEQYATQFANEYARRIPLEQLREIIVWQANKNADELTEWIKTKQ